MTHYFKFLGLISLSLLLSSCSTKLSDYSANQSNFDLQEYFNGDVIA